jgi:exosome complex component RRP46
MLTRHPGPRERHLETLLHSTLRTLILVRSIPRTLVQITLQVRSLPEEDSTTGLNTVRPHQKMRC